MPLLNLSREQLLGMFQQLLPRGRVWPRAPDAMQARSLLPLMGIYERLIARDNNLVADAFPGTAYELLPDWEKSLGLPSQCSGLADTIQGRQAAVVARFTSTGGQSRAYFISVAAALGYTVTIAEYRPSRLGSMRMGDRMQSAEWAHVWAIQAPATTVIDFRMGRSALGERFRVWGNTVLECELSAIKPAHTTLLFQYI